jgi:hypothetical protein
MHGLTECAVNRTRGKYANWLSHLGQLNVSMLLKTPHAPRNERVGVVGLGNNWAEKEGDKRPVLRRRFNEMEDS